MQSLRNQSVHLGFQLPSALFVQTFFPTELDAGALDLLHRFRLRHSVFQSGYEFVHCVLHIPSTAFPLHSLRYTACFDDACFTGALMLFSHCVTLRSKAQDSRSFVPTPCWVCGQSPRLWCAIWGQRALRRRLLLQNHLCAFFASARPCVYTFYRCA